MPKISINEAAKILGVHTDTLRRWEESGKTKPERTVGGHRRYDLGELLGVENDSGLTKCLRSRQY
jgi:putative resolvase